MPPPPLAYKIAVVCLAADALALPALARLLDGIPALHWHCAAASDASAVAHDAVLLLVDAAATASACAQLQALRSSRPALPALVVAAGPAVCAFERLLASGATDFVCLPAGAAELLPRLSRLLGMADAVPSAAAAAGALPAASGPALIGHSAAFVQATARIPRLAACDAGVLILGETGTGKEVCAQAIHYRSARAAGPWVAINCGAIPQELVEDELFGHVRGAYTHAHSARIGLVAEAEHGTLLLDEVDALPPAAQAKLLRFLQDKQYRQVGSSTLRQADVRVIAASNRALDRLVQRGEFRQDLYFRLNVLTLTLPPLRERRDDIAELAGHFLAGALREAGRHGGGLTPGALRRLVEHAWPGNVRELQHTIERAVLLGSGSLLQASDIELDGVPAGSADAAAAGADDECFRSAKARVVQHFERDYIERALQASAGNIANAARMAQKNRRAFFELLRKHAIDAERFRH